MKSFVEKITLNTGGRVEFIDITGRVSSICEKSGIRDGLATIFTRHTTTAVKVNERCARLQEDMLAMLKRVVPEGRYLHDEDTVDCRANARGHMMSLLMNTSETIPVACGKISLGTWQSIFFIEFDGPRDGRAITVNVIGE